LRVDAVSARKRLRAALAGCALALASLVAGADEGGLQLSPIRLDLSVKQRGGALTLTNKATTRKTIQVDVVAWSQQAGEDVYTPSTALLANPPLFFLDPGASQVVRVGLPAAARNPAPVEQAFRVFLREVPDERPLEVPGLRVAMRLGVPVFIAPASGGAPQVQWSGAIGADGIVTITLSNSGNIHVRAADLRLVAPDGEVLGHDGTMHYALAGSRQAWRIKPSRPVSPGPMRLSALMEDGVREFPVVLPAP
jgi:fimbrial chaperone protein